MIFLTTFIGLMLPFLGTALGSACVFLMRDRLNELLEKSLLGFASGVMVAAAVWSLIIPSVNMSESMGKLAFVPAAAGIALGVLFLLGMDRVIPHLHTGSNEPEGSKMGNHMKKTTLLTLAVTLHNIPEGMAVGVVFAGMLSGEGEITMAAAFALTIGIAVQNFPEGAIISMPLKTEGHSRLKGFLYGTLSGAVEPVAAGVTILLTGILTPILPYLLAFAAGAMLYVVVEELLPEASGGKKDDITTIGFAAGFIVMMILDVALG